MVDKNKLKKEYLLTLKPAGIFKIENKINGKIFLSGSFNLDKIFNRHVFQLQQKVHPNGELQSDWNKYGSEKFLFEVVKEIKLKDDPLFDLKREMENLLKKTIESTPADKRYNDK